MKTRIKTLALFSILLAGVCSAGAQAQEPNSRQRPLKKLADFNCPVCGSPCVNKTVLRRQIHHRRLQNQERQRLNPERTEHMRQQARRRFDFDRDGQLSKPERAAMRAYRNTIRQERGI